jgi:hypothetical protein
MKTNPADKPKVIALLVAIVLIGGYGIISFAGRKGPAPTPPGLAADNSNLPTAEMLAEGKTRADAPKEKTEDLSSVFPGSDPAMAITNPFRSPVPKAASTASQAPAVNTRPLATYAPPTMSGTKPFKPFGEGGIGTGSAPTVQSIEPMLVKGIIAPPEGEASGMAFIKVGNVAKGFRVGDLVTSGVRVTAISTGAVTVRIGAKTVTASVGQQIKLFEDPQQNG